jgi:hypothetical protein
MRFCSCAFGWQVRRFSAQRQEWAAVYKHLCLYSLAGARVCNLYLMVAARSIFITTLPILAKISFYTVNPGDQNGTLC